MKLEHFPAILEKQWRISKKSTLNDVAERYLVAPFLVPFPHFRFGTGPHAVF